MNKGKTLKSTKLIFKNKIAYYRGIHGLTQQQLADKVGKPLSFIAHLETNGSFPRVNTRTQMLSSLNCTFNELFYEVKEGDS